MLCFAREMYLLIMKHQKTVPLNENLNLKWPYFDVPPPSAPTFPDSPTGLDRVDWGPQEVCAACPTAGDEWRALFHVGIPPNNASVRSHGPILTCRPPVPPHSLIPQLDLTASTGVLRRYVRRAPLPETSGGLCFTSESHTAFFQRVAA